MTKLPKWQLACLSLAVCLLTWVSGCKKEPVIPPPPPPVDECLFMGVLDTCYTIANLSSFSSLDLQQDLPGNPGRIVTAADGSFIMSVHPGSVFRSTNQGGTWQLSYQAPITRSGYLSVGPSGEVFLGLPTHGLFRSTDHGASFTALPANGLPIMNDYVGVGISVAPNNDIYVYLGWGDLDPDSLFKSSDGGSTFVPIPLPNPGEWVMFQNPPIQHTPSGRLFLSNRYGVYHSDDDGQNWTTVFQSWEDFFTYVLKDGRIICSGNNTSYLSLDGGDNFQELNSWIWTIHGALPNGDLLGRAAYQDEFLMRSTDNGNSWIPHGSLYAAPSSVGINANGAVGFIGTNQVNWDINQNYWTCTELPDVPSLGPWVDFDVEGQTIALVAGQYTFVSTNRGYNWAIGQKLDWDATSIDVESISGKIMVGLGVQGGSPLDGNFCILNSNGTSIIESRSSLQDMNVNDVAYLNDQTWVLSLGWPTTNIGYIVWTENGGDNYSLLLEDVQGNLPYTLFYDSWAEFLYYGKWAGESWMSGWNYSRIRFTPASGPTGDWETFGPEAKYEVARPCLAWTRRMTSERMFLSLHAGNHVLYQDQSHWMFRSAYLDLPEFAHEIKFDDLGYLWALTDNGLFRTNGIPSIHY